MKFFSFLVIIVLVISLAGCSKIPESGNTPEEKPESPQGSGTSEEISGKQPEEKPEEFDWTINVDDAISGSYEMPMGGKSIEYDITLRLVAWKSGGSDVYGRYEGEAYILFKFDESGLSDADILYMGGGTFNRKCEKLEFEVEAYDLEKLNRKTVPMPDNKVSVVPLQDFNAMASSKSVWTTILIMDQTVRSMKSGAVLSDIKGETGESSSDLIGIDFFIDDGHVTVDIPTYRLTWNCGYFTGNVDRSPLGTAKREKLDMPDASLENSDSTDVPETEEPPQTDQKEDIPSDLLPDDYKDKYIENDPNGLSGFDMNGDGKVDAYIDEDGKFQFDIDFDGKFDDLENDEGVEWGQG